jgi:hypothetical protein
VRMLNNRERKALLAMSNCHYEYELRGRLGSGVGQATIDGLIRRGFAKVGPSPRQRGQIGYAITEQGRTVLDESYSSSST